MRIIILIFIAILPVTIFSQVDSTTIYYKNIENYDLRTICELTDIQIEKIYCNDTLLRGKVFNVKIKEFKKGKVVSTDNLDVSSEEQRIPMVINGDTIIYIIPMVDKAGFGKSTDTLSITFAGLLDKKKLKLKINYPGMSMHKELKGNSNYSLRPANSCSSNKIRVPVEEEYPILAYTPPFDTGSEIQSYCLLGEENVLDWYDKFKVKHYYIIYLEIK